MSSRVIRGADTEAQPVPWPVSSGVSSSANTAVFPVVNGGEFTSAADRVPELEARLQNLRLEAEQRVKAAQEQAFREGDAAARRQLASQVEAAADRLSRTAEELSGLKARLRHEAEEQVVKLAIAIARRILHREISTDPEAILGLVRAALDKLDAREVSSLRVHPEAAAVVREQLKKIGLTRPLEVVADATLPPGGAIFETSRGSLDASAESQLMEIERGFADLVRRT